MTHKTDSDLAGLCLDKFVSTLPLNHPDDLYDLALISLLMFCIESSHNLKVFYDIVSTTSWTCHDLMRS